MGRVVPFDQAGWPLHAMPRQATTWHLLGRHGGLAQGPRKFLWLCLGFLGRRCACYAQTPERVGELFSRHLHLRRSNSCAYQAGKPIFRGMRTDTPVPEPEGAT